MKVIAGVKDNDKWTIDGKAVSLYDNFDFIDISLSPFTNTLPIKNLKLKTNEEKEINVIYIDILNERADPVKQKYIKKSNNNYRYEKIPNDFEADIDVDEFGFVTSYPRLFHRVAKY